MCLLSKFYNQSDRDSFWPQLAILMEIDHPNIVKLEGVYESEDCIYLLQELCSGGNFFDRLDAQAEEHYSEAQCARLVKQMLSAVRYTL
jgi:calcium-dependent protein kinase